MCDALTATLISGALSVATAGASYAGQMAQQSAQKKSNADWVAYQEAAARRSAAADDAARAQAEAARQKTLGAVSPDAEAADAAATTKRLVDQTAPLAPAAYTDDPNTAMLSGQADSQNTGMSKEIARLASAGAQSARPIVQAMSTINGYTGAYGSALDTSNRAINTGNQDIYAANDARKGNLMTLGISQNVQPRSYTQGQDIGGTLAASLGNLAGSAFGNYMTTPAKKPA